MKRMKIFCVQLISWLSFFQRFSHELFFLPRSIYSIFHIADVFFAVHLLVNRIERLLSFFIYSLFSHSLYSPAFAYTCERELNESQEFSVSFWWDFYYLFFSLSFLSLCLFSKIPNPLVCNYNFFFDWKFIFDSLLISASCFALLFKMK